METKISLYLLTQPVSKMIPVEEIKHVSGMSRVVREVHGNVEWFLRSLQVSPQSEHGVMGNLIDPSKSRCAQIQELTAKIAKIDELIRRHAIFAAGSTEKQVTVMQLRVFLQLFLEALSKLTEIEVDERTSTMRPLQLVTLRWGASR